MLETLDISNCDQLGTKDLLKIMSRLPLLDNLNISNCSNVDGLIFDRLTEFPNLRAVRSSSNQQIEFDSVSRFLGSSSKIKLVSLSRSHIFKRTLTPLALCSSLDNLDVSSCGLSIVREVILVYHQHVLTLPRPGYSCRDHRENAKLALNRMR
jgi:hypothetical protein